MPSGSEFVRLASSVSAKAFGDVVAIATLIGIWLDPDSCHLRLTFLHFGKILDWEIVRRLPECQPSMLIRRSIDRLRLTSAVTKVEAL